MKSIRWFGQVIHVGLARAVLIKRPLEKVRDKYLAEKIACSSCLAACSSWKGEKAIDPGEPTARCQVHSIVI